MKKQLEKEFSKIRRLKTDLSVEKEQRVKQEYNLRYDQSLKM